MTAAESPFAPPLARHQLPRAFRDQFLVPGDRLVLEGRMDSVWRHGRWTRPLFSLLARFDMLFPETGRDVPAALEITPQADGHAWRREFRFPRRRHFDATLAWDRRLGRVVERTGPLTMVWRVRFEPPDTLRIETERALLGGLSVPAPRVQAVERALADDRIRVEVRMGRLFGYGGEFRLRRG